MDDMISPHPHRHQYVGQAALFRPLTAASINGWASQPVPDKYALATDKQTNKQTNKQKDSAITARPRICCEAQ